MKVLLCLSINLISMVAGLTISRGLSSCALNKPGTEDGKATLFQPDYPTGGACGFKQPNNQHAAGYFVAVGGDDWNNGYSCGGCLQLEYQGRKVVVNVVDRCGGCSTGHMDMGGAAWKDLTDGEPPGVASGVSSKWIKCPDTFTNGGNMKVYVKTGSQPWDYRLQPVLNEEPIVSLHIRGSNGDWLKMKKCENYMFCKPSSLILTGDNSNYEIRVTSTTGNIDKQMSSIPDGTFVDMGSNNGGHCPAGQPISPKSPKTESNSPDESNTDQKEPEMTPALAAAENPVTTTAPADPVINTNPSANPDPATNPTTKPDPTTVNPNPTTKKPSATTVKPNPTTNEPTQTTIEPSSTSSSEPITNGSSTGDCLQSGLIPDPEDCAGFIVCAQGVANRFTCGLLYFDIAVNNCNIPDKTDCGSRPKPDYRR